MSKKTPPKKLFRSETQKVVAGVCGGVAEYFDLDSTLVRLFFVVALIFGGSGMMAYILMWIFIPSESSVKLDSNEYIKKNTDELKEKAEEFAKKAQGISTQENSKVFLGIFLILLGTGILLNNLGFWHIRFEYIWPLLLIVLGLSIITKEK